MSDPINTAEISEEPLDQPEQNLEVIASRLQEIDEDMLLATRTLSETRSPEPSATIDLIEPEISDFLQITVDSSSILDSDPSDYSVALDSTVVLQASESIGQLANWLEIPTWDIRRLNNMSFRDQICLLYTSPSPRDS